ncbi:MAG: hypothetical protein AB8B80_01315 [Marinicellaceae bacterium]
MNQSLPIINLDNQWYLMQGSKLQKMTKPETLTGSNIVISDFQDAVFGLEMVTGPIEHAGALVEKRLRDIGLLDGPSKIIIHETRKVGDTATVIFTAIPADTYTEYFEMVNKQKDHCLLVPLLSVLCKEAVKDKIKNKALVFQHNREFDLIIVKDKKIKQISRLTAFSTDEDDVNQTLETLAEELNSHNLEDNKIEVISWMSFIESDDDLSNKLNKLTNVEVIKTSQTDIQFENKSVKTSISGFFEDISAKDAANDNTSQMLYVSEKILPLVAVVFVAVIGYLCMLWWNWNAEIKDIKNQLAQSNKAQLTSELRSIENELSITNKQFATNQNAKTTSQWLYDLKGIQSIPNPKQLVDDIGQALPDDVQITGISLDSRSIPATVLLEGVIEKSLKLAMKDLENMSTKLLERGYTMQSDTSIELGNNNDFRITLKVDYNDK